MATYTDNYNLTKPTMSELADIRVINSNMDAVDEIMHGSQVSIADAYDPTLTYDVGDLVMNSFLLYKCVTAVTTPEAFDPTKWERTTAVDEGGGGSSGGGINYSTTEQNTGLKWIDGRDVYQKTYSFSQTPYIPSNQWTDLTETSNVGIDTVIEASILSPTGTYWDAFAIAVDTGDYIKVLNMRNAEITIKYLTIKYVKTATP